MFQVFCCKQYTYYSSKQKSKGVISGVILPKSVVLLFALIIFYPQTLLWHIYRCTILLEDCYLRNTLDNCQWEGTLVQYIRVFFTCNVSVSVAGIYCIFKQFLRLLIKFYIYMANNTPFKLLYLRLACFHISKLFMVNYEQN